MREAYEKAKADLLASQISNERLNKEKEASVSDATNLRQQPESAQSNRQRRPRQLGIVPRMQPLEVLESPHDTKIETNDEEMDAGNEILISEQQGSFRTPGGEQQTNNREPNQIELLLQRLVVLQKKKSKVLTMMKKMPGVPISIQREALNGFAATPFSNELSRARIPRRLSLPTFTSLYDDTTCLEQHV